MKKNIIFIGALMLTLTGFLTNLSTATVAGEEQKKVLPVAETTPVVETESVPSVPQEASVPSVVTTPEATAITPVSTPAPEPAKAASNAKPELFNLDEEESILFMKIPVIIASSKREQLITETSSTIDVVTAEDIKQSGATNLGDVLRSIAGIDVRESDAGQHVIGIRGLADTGHVLVTLDGNNVFMYHANHIFLDWAPFDLEEVDRIEIIKGPGAIFYGGNAFNGVINIITKSPKQLEGGQINAVTGNWDTVRTNGIYAGTFKNLEYSIAGGHRGSRAWEEPKIPQSGENYYVSYIDGKIIYRFDEESALTLQSHYSQARNVISRVCNPDTTFVALNYKTTDFSTRLFYNNHSKTFWDDTFSVDDANYEFEILRTLRWGDNVTSFGAYAKNTNWAVGKLKGAGEGTTEKHAVEDYALNFENEYRINKQWIFTLGMRGEYYTYLDFMGLGRGSLVFKPTETQSLRLTVASGYYIPSLFQHTNEGTAYPFALGNYDLEEEKIISSELGYYFQLNKWMKLSSNIYYNDYRDLIDNTQTGPTQNITDAYQYGGELELDFMFTNWLTGFANYAYQNLHRYDFEDLSLDPKHKVNLGLRAKMGRWSANMAFHYVDEYYELYLTSNPVFGRVGAGPCKVEAYNTLDARVAYQPNENLELAVAATNLFNYRHYESNSTGWHAADIIDRRITASMSVKF